MRTIRGVVLVLLSCVAQLACGKVVNDQPDAAPVPIDGASNVDLTITLSGSGRVTGGTDVDCTSNCVVTLPRGTAITLHAAPAPGSLFTGWAGDCTGSGDCVLTLDGDTAVSATFAPGITLTVTTTGDATPQVTADLGGIDCGGDCTEVYPAGTQVTLSATSVDGVLTGWSGPCSGTDTCVVVLDADTTVTADFRQLIMDTAPVVSAGSETDQRCDGAISTAITATQPTTITRLETDINVLNAATNIRFAIFDQSTSTLVFYSDPVAAPLGRSIVSSPVFSFTMTVGTRYHFAAMVEGCAGYPYDLTPATENGLQTFSTNGNPTGYAAPVGPNECCSVDPRFLIYGHR